jgi:hypothetical protein
MGVLYAIDISYETRITWSSDSTHSDIDSREQNLESARSVPSPNGIADCINGTVHNQHSADCHHILPSTNIHHTFAHNHSVRREHASLSIWRPLAHGGTNGSKDSSPPSGFQTTSSTDHSSSRQPCDSREKYSATGQGPITLAAAEPPRSILKLNSTRKIDSVKKQTLACLFCRERKIVYDRPAEGSADTTCK